MVCNTITGPKKAVFRTRFILWGQLCVSVQEHFVNVRHFLLILLSFNVTDKLSPEFLSPTATTETPQECLTSKSLHTCMHSHNWIRPIVQGNRREALTSGYFYVHGAAIQSLNDSSILMRCLYEYPPHTHTHTHTHTRTHTHTAFPSDWTNLLSVARFSHLLMTSFE